MYTLVNSLGYEWTPCHLLFLKFRIKLLQYNVYNQYRTKYLPSWSLTWSGIFKNSNKKMWCQKHMGDFVTSEKTYVND